jgi:heptosyltransferase-2
MVMATPFLLSLRHSTGGELWAAGKPSAMHLYNGLNLFDRFIPYDGRSVVGFLDLVSSVRRARFDRGIVLPHSFRSALLFFLGRVRERVGYSRNGRGMMLTSVVADLPSRAEPTVEHYLRILDLVDFDRVVEAPLLQVTEDEERRFDDAFADVGGAYVVFIVGAQYGPSKRWPDGYFSELADLLAERFSVSTYLLPGRGEEEIARRIRDGARHKEWVRIRSMNVMQMKVCLARASLVVTNDTGPRHISAALSTPTVVILGPMDERYTLYPNDFTHSLSKNLSCRPCNKRECSRDHECLKGIKPEEVLEKIEEVLGDRPLIVD